MSTRASIGQQIYRMCIWSFTREYCLTIPQEQERLWQKQLHTKVRSAMSTYEYIIWFSTGVILLITAFWISRVSFV
ncbi:MAG: hypothetical protein WBZ36_20850, partial [Candidatus Nitrosopolaris sp.]